MVWGLTWQVSKTSELKVTNVVGLGMGKGLILVMTASCMGIILYCIELNTGIPCFTYTHFTYIREYGQIGVYRKSWSA